MKCLQLTLCRVLPKKALSNDKLRKLAQASSKAVYIAQQMQKAFKRTFREHDISYASYKKHKSDKLARGTPGLHNAESKGWLD